MIQLWDSYDRQWVGATDPSGYGATLALPAVSGELARWRLADTTTSSLTDLVGGKVLTLKGSPKTMPFAWGTGVYCYSSSTGLYVKHNDFRQYVDRSYELIVTNYGPNNNQGLLQVGVAAYGDGYETANQQLHWVYTASTGKQVIKWEYGDGPVPGSYTAFDTSLAQTRRIPTYYALTHDSTAVRLYVDGRLWAESLSPTASTGGTGGTTGLGLGLAGCPVDTASIDASIVYHAVAVHSRALTAAEVESRYARTLAPIHARMT